MPAFRVSRASGHAARAGGSTACVTKNSMEEDMGAFAALDVSQESTAICVIDAGSGAMLAEGKVTTCPEAISTWLARWSGQLDKIAMETGPLAVWLWNALAAKGLPIVVLDARHANAALKMMPNKTDRHDARGLAQIVRTGWFKPVRIKATGPTSCGRC